MSALLSPGLLALLGLAGLRYSGHRFSPCWRWLRGFRSSLLALRLLRGLRIARPRRRCHCLACELLRSWGVPAGEGVLKCRRSPAPWNPFLAAGDPGETETGPSC